jgi:hypothetical protein
MRDLTAPERQDIISANGYPDDGSGKFIEAKVSDLAAANIGTACGGPWTFDILNNNGYPHRKVRGYLVDDAEEGRSYLTGMIFIKIQTETTAEKIETLVDQHGSYLRWDGETDPSITPTLAGFMVFEDE